MSHPYRPAIGHVFLTEREKRQLQEAHGNVQAGLRAALDYYLAPPAGPTIVAHVDGTPYETQLQVDRAYTLEELAAGLGYRVVPCGD